MDAAFVNAAFAAVAFAMAFGVVRAVKYLRRQRQMQRMRQARTQPDAEVPVETRNKNKRRRLEQKMEKDAKAAQRGSHKG